MVKVGILGLQGDVREHERAIADAGATSVVVKHPQELDDVDALVLPGGESTTIGKMLDRFGFLGPLKERAAGGMPLYGTCAGLILMARRVISPHEAPHLLELLDVAVRRNGYGRQVDSFEADIHVEGLPEPVRAAFIRAPVIEQTGPEVQVLATFEDKPVLVRQGHLLASSFHPEIAGDSRIHSMFLEMAEGVH